MRNARMRNARMRNARFKNAKYKRAKWKNRYDILRNKDVSFVVLGDMNQS